MSWEVEIHHIDVTGTGDATLIIAIERDAVSNDVEQIRTMLIDGGRQQYATDVHNYITAQFNRFTNAELHVIVVTHYDEDHIEGVTELLRMTSTTNNAELHPFYRNTMIFDQGWHCNLGEAYSNYLTAINGIPVSGSTPQLSAPRLLLNNRNRVSKTVLTDENKNHTHIVIPSNLKNTGLPAIPSSMWEIRHSPHSLLNQNLFWYGEADAPADAPSVRCLAVNGYVLTDTNSHIYAATLTADANAFSIACILEFNKFSYYIGGDIEDAQEEIIMTHLNPNNLRSARVQVIKTSHHGSKGGTSRAFVNRLKPVCAIISCGTQNSFPHPAPETVNVLEGYLRTRNDGNSIERIGGAYPPRRPIIQLLTGYGQVTPLRSGGGSFSITSGAPGAYSGNIALFVSEEQSNAPPEGKNCVLLRAAIEYSLTATNYPGDAAFVGTEAATHILNYYPLPALVIAVWTIISNHPNAGEPPALAAFIYAAGEAAFLAYYDQKDASKAATDAFENTNTAWNSQNIVRTIVGAVIKLPRNDLRKAGATALAACVGLFPNVSQNVFNAARRAGLLWRVDALPTLITREVFSGIYDGTNLFAAVAASVATGVYVSQGNTNSVVNCTATALQLGGAQIGQNEMDAVNNHIQNAVAALQHGLFNFEVTNLNGQIVRRTFN